MPTRIVTARRQITLGTDIIAHMGVRPGDHVIAECLPGRTIHIGPAEPHERAALPKGHISDIFGILKREGTKPLSIDEMNEIGPPDDPFGK